MSIIKDSAGKGVAGALICFKQNGADVKICQTNTEGYFYTNLDIGDYEYSVTARNFLEYTGFCSVTEEGLDLQVTINREVIDAVVKVKNIYDYNLSDCSVRLVREDDESETYDLTTDSTGTCTFNDIKSANYHVIFNCLGYCEESVLFEFNSVTPTLYKDLMIDSSSLLSNYSVCVNDSESGVSVGGASVVLAGTKTVTMFTDSDGVAHFNNKIPRGVYNIHVSNDEYSPTDKNNILIFDEDIITEVSLVKHNLDPLFRVNLVDVTGSGVSGATVQLLIDDIVKYSTVSDSIGIASFTNVLCTNYTVKVVHDEYYDSLSEYLVYYGCPDYAVTLNKKPVLRDFKILTCDSVSSAPINGVMVNVTDAHGSMVMSGITDNNGELLIPDLVVGDVYTAECVHSDYDSVVQDFTPTESVGYTTIFMDQGEVTGATVTVNVVDKYHQTVVNESDVVLSSSRKQYTGKTDENGSITFDNVRIGVYTLSVNKEGYDLVTLNEKSIIDDVTYDVELLIPYPMIIKSLSGDEPLSGVTVNVYDGVITTYSGVTNEDGIIDTTGISPAPFVLGESYLLEAMKKGYYKTGTGVNIMDESVPHTISLSLDKLPVGVVDFVIKNEDNNGIDDVSVKLFNDDFTFTGVTDTDGALSLDNIPYGEYTLSCNHPNYNSYYGTVTVDSESKTVPLVLSNADFTTVLFTVKNEDKELLRDVVIDIRDSETGTLLCTGHTNYDGEYTCNMLIMGNSYKVDCSKTDYYFERTSITVDETQKVNIIMSRSSDKRIREVITVINDLTYEKVRDAKVTLSAGSYQEEQFTNSEGIVVFNNLKDGHYYRLIVSKNDYETHISEETFTDDGELTIELKDMHTYNSVAVKVFDDDGFVSDAFVEIDTTGRDYSGSTDEEGVIYFERVPHMSGIITVTKDSYEVVSEEHMLEGVIEINIHHKTIMDEGFVRVVDDVSESPLQNVHVDLTYLDIGKEQYNISGVTNEDGKLVLPDSTLEGFYHLKVQYSDSDGYFNTYELEELELSRDNNIINVLLEWKKFNNVNVRVRDSKTNELIPNVHISFKGNLPNTYPIVQYNKVTGDSGAYLGSICNIPYVVTLACDGYTINQFDYLVTSANITFKMDRVQVDTSAKVLIHDWLSEEIIDESCSVTFEQLNAQHPMIIPATKTGAGTYEVASLKSGYYDIRVVPTNEDYQEAFWEQVLVDPDSSKNVYDFYIIKNVETKKNITVRASDEYGGLSESITVQLVNENPKVPILTPTSILEGVYVFAEVPIGEYTLKCTNSDVYDDNISYVTIEEDNQSILVDMIRSYCNDFNVLVMDKFGAYVPDALVNIKNSNDEVVFEEYTRSGTGIANVGKIHKGIYNFSISKAADELNVSREIFSSKDSVTMKFLLNWDVAPIVRINLTDTLEHERVTGAIVKLKNEYMEQIIVEDLYDLGLYVAHDFPVGDYDLVITCDGFDDLLEKVRIDIDTTLLYYELEPKRPEKVPNFKINIHNKYGDPVKRADVLMVTQVSPFSDTYRHLTNINGEVYFNNEVYIGNWGLFVNHADYHQFSEQVPVSLDYNEHNVELTELNPIPIPTYTVLVTGMDTGATVTGAEVIFTNRDTGEEHTGTTDSEGELIFSNLSSPLYCGYYDVTVKHSNYAEYTKHNVLCSLRNTSCSIVLPKIITDFKTIVRDEFNLLVEGATVNLKNLDTEIEYSVDTNDDGTATYHNILHTGTYDLNITKVGFKSLTVSNIVLGKNPETLNLNIKSDQPDNEGFVFDIYDDYLCNIRGGLVYVEEPVSYELENIMGDKWEGVSDKYHTIGLSNLPTGRYEFRIKHDNFELCNRSFDLNGNYIQDAVFLKRKMVNITISPLNLMTSMYINSDSMMIKDLKGYVLVDKQVLDPFKYEYSVMVPCMKIVPIFDGVYFNSDNPLDWMGPDEYIDVSSSMEGHHFDFRVRPIPYLRVHLLSAIDTSKSLPCNVQVKDSTGNVQFEGPVTNSYKEIKYILPKHNVHKDSYTISCTSLAGYDPIRPKEVTGEIVSQEEVTHEYIELVPIIKSATITFYMGSSAHITGDLTFTLTDHTSKTYAGSGHAYGSGGFVLNVDSSFDLAVGNIKIHAEGEDRLHHHDVYDGTIYFGVTGSISVELIPVD